MRPSPPASGPLRTEPPAWGWYLAWAIVGAGVALSLLAVMTIGIFIAPFVGLAGLALCRRPRARSAATGLIFGLAVPVLWVAWLNHDGPGNVCTTTPTSQSCVEEYSPWPFLALAVALVTAALAASVLLRRQGQVPAPLEPEAR